MSALEASIRFERLTFGSRGRLRAGAIPAYTNRSYRTNEALPTRCGHPASRRLELLIAPHSERPGSRARATPARPPRQAEPPAPRRSHRRHRHRHRKYSPLTPLTQPPQPTHRTATRPHHGVSPVRGATDTKRRHNPSIRRSCRPHLYRSALPPWHGCRASQAILAASPGQRRLRQWQPVRAQEGCEGSECARSCSPPWHPRSCASGAAAL